MVDLNKIYEGDALEVLKKMPGNFVNCCVTSPPYYGLRDYGIDKQLGLEKTPEEYVEKLVKIFREVKRVLRDDGIFWLNLGDSYFGSNSNKNAVTDKNTLSAKKGHIKGGKKEATGIVKGLKPKDLIGIPWRSAFALQKDGWYLRSDIIWHKKNPLPESVRDRPTKAHEYIFLLSKSAKYYYDQDAIKTEMKDVSITRAKRGLSEDNKWNKGAPGSTARTISRPRKNINQMKTPDGWDTSVGNGGHGSFHKKGREKGYKGYKHRGSGDKKLTGHSGNFDAAGRIIGDGRANKRSVWEVPTKGYKEAHFATFPPKLIEDCIKAGCPVGGIVLDPFIGSGTTAIVARKQDKNYIGIDLNSDYIKMAENRINKELGLFK